MRTIILLILMIFMSLYASPKGKTQNPILPEVFPDATDIPKGPLSIKNQAPGGNGLPEIQGNANENAPAISMISDQTYPDETLIITGNGLDSAHLVIWAEGKLQETEPLRTFHNRIQAVIPKDFPKTTMLVWPVKDHKTGEPIRINGATAWWAWPAMMNVNELKKEQTVLIMGRNLQIGEAEPKVYLEGPGMSGWLNVTGSNPYQIEALLPLNLMPGKYTIWAHNGTGGIYGWSDGLEIEFVDIPVNVNLQVFHVDHYGAVPDNGQDDYNAIEAALQAANEAGGGIIQFSSGTYHTGKEIRVSGIVPIHFQGSGMGEYDDSGLNDLNHFSLKGTYTAIYPLPDSRLTEIIELLSSNSSIKKLTLVNDHYGRKEVKTFRPGWGVDQAVARAYGQGQTLVEVRLIFRDKRPQIPHEERESLSIEDASLHIKANGMAHITIENCEFLFHNGGIQIGNPQFNAADEGTPELSTDYVRIENCLFRGYYDGWYTYPEDQSQINSRPHGNERPFGIQILNGKNLIVGHNDFAGASKNEGKVISRSIYVRNTSTQNLYIANNNMNNAGPIRPDYFTTRRVNQGEQVLYHFHYPGGGYFDVLESTVNSVVLNPNDPRNEGEINPHANYADRRASRILPEVGENGHWIIFVAAGKGVGQYRVVTGTNWEAGQGVELKLEKPWRVIPDKTSRVVLTAAFRQNIHYNNTINGGFIDRNSKSGGVLIWFNGFDNITAGNEFINLGFGASNSTMLRNPTGWNLTRDNVMRTMRSYAGDQAPGPAFFAEKMYPLRPQHGGEITYTIDNPEYVDIAGWYSVGNTYRSNKGHDAETAFYITGPWYAHGSLSQKSSNYLFPDEDSGLMMTVIENNHFTGVDQGIVYSYFASWLLLRNNIIEADGLRYISDPQEIPEDIPRMNTALIIENRCLP